MRTDMKGPQHSRQRQSHQKNGLQQLQDEFSILQADRQVLPEELCIEVARILDPECGSNPSV